MDFEHGGDAAQRLRDHIPQVRARVAEFDLSPYGLDAGWAGQRWLAANHSSSGRLNGTAVDRYVSVELAHGAHRDRGPLLLVETARHDIDGNVPVVHRWEVDDVMTAPGQPVSLLLDGAPVEAEAWRRGDVQIATFRPGSNHAGDIGVGKVRVTVRARAWADLAGERLVSVADVEPYLAGREIMLHRRRR